MTATERLDHLDALHADLAEVAPLPWEVAGNQYGRQYADLMALDARGDIVADYSTSADSPDDAAMAARLVEAITALVNDAPALTRALRTVIALAEELERPVFRPEIARTDIEQAENHGADRERRKIALILLTRIDHALDGD